MTIKNTGSVDRKTERCGEKHLKMQVEVQRRSAIRNPQISYRGGHVAPHPSHT